ncbi:hypothetical protein [Enterobacter sp. PTB]|uniref:hypothetical protein n=1 Tax=Enterobacter sp. PTB TaxID=3143437 RepID=UPI003DA9E1B7
MKNTTTHPQGRDSHDLNNFTRPAFTWLFLGIPKDDARANLAGGFTLEFVAKIRTDRTVFDSWWDKHNCMLWTLQGTDATCAKEIAGLHHG